MRNKRRLAVIIAVVMCLLANAVPAFAVAGLSDDPNITVVSPTKNQVMKTGKVLVSVKMTAPKTIRMDFYKVTKSGRTVVTSEKYSSNKNLSYYTRQLTGLNPGVYAVRISTLDSSGKAIYATEIAIKVEKKTSESVNVNVFNSTNTSNSFWQSLIQKLL